MIHSRDDCGVEDRDSLIDGLGRIIQEGAEVWITRKPPETSHTLMSTVHNHECPIRKRYHAWHNALRRLQNYISVQNLNLESSVFTMRSNVHTGLGPSG
jgi:hypothetical protein